jgi:Arc/MetJ family transcription regulator
MSRMTVTVADELIEEAKKALGTETRAETIRIALKEAIRRKRLAEALEHEGRIDLDAGQDELRRLRGEG